MRDRDRLLFAAGAASLLSQGGKVWRPNFTKKGVSALKKSRRRTAKASRVRNGSKGGK